MKILIYKMSMRINDDSIIWVCFSARKDAWNIRRIFLGNPHGGFQLAKKPFLLSPLGFKLFIDPSRCQSDSDSDEASPDNPVERFPHP